MKVYSQLEIASWENVTVDPTLLPVGRFWLNTVTKRAKIRVDGALTKSLFYTDDPLIVGLDATAANNIRLHRGGTAFLQVVPASDVTAEGTKATTLAQFSSRTENYVNASKPANGNIGRVIYVTDTNKFEYDNGTVWQGLGGGALVVSSQTISAAAAILFSGTTSRQLFKVTSSGGEQDLSALTPQIQPATDEGQELVIVGQSDTNYFILKNGNGLKLNGDFVGTADAVIKLVWLNSKWIETGRA